MPTGLQRLEAAGSGTNHESMHSTPDASGAAAVWECCLSYPRVLTRPRPNSDLGGELLGAMMRGAPFSLALSCNLKLQNRPKTSPLPMLRKAISASILFRSTLLQRPGRDISLQLSFR